MVDDDVDCDPISGCRLVQEATNNEPCVPDAKTLACIADAAFDMDDFWRIAKVLHQRLSRAADWKEWCTRRWWCWSSC
jgi:hypothetical protein